VRFLKRRKKVGREIRGPVRIAPGERAEATVGVSPPKQIWIGRGALHPFQVAVRPVGSDIPGPPAAGTFRQLQWLPWWLMIVVPLLVIGAFWLLSMRTSEGTVPDVASAPDVFAAKTLLEDSGFALGETFEEVSTKAKPGTIIEQSPAAGTSAADGSAVSLKVAVGAEKVAVPDLTGQTADQAKATLTAAGFQLGRPLNKAADPASAKIANQIPVPDSLEASGAAIDVVFAETAVAGSTTPAAPATAPAPTPPPPGTPPPAPGTPATTPAPATSTPGSPPAPPATPPRAPVPLPVPTGTPAVTPSPETPGGGIKVPAVAGATQAAAADALAKLGLVPGVISAASSSVPAGTVISQQPASGAEVAAGATVAITISRGYSAVIYDLNGDIVRVGGATGEPVEPLAASPEIEEQANASFTTPLIAYRRGPEGSTPGVAPNGQIWVIDPSDPRSARPLTDAGFDDRRPAISPDGAVVAFVSNRGSRPDDYDLCFARIDRSQQKPRCIADRDVNVSRPAWSPDGRSLLVTASDGPQTELLLLTSVVPSSGTPSDWTAQGLITNAMHKDRKTDQVLSSAFSPDGTKLAFSANWKSTTFTLWLVDVTNGVIGTEAKQQPYIAACELAWRPDGGELAIAQRNSTCDERGRIVRVDPAAPNAQTLLSRLDAASGNPAWAPPGG
jgi:beta-lactam-binding protein with PASTA domain